MMMMLSYEAAMETLVFLPLISLSPKFCFVLSVILKEWFPGISRVLYGYLSAKEFSCQCSSHSRCKLYACIRKIPWRRKWQPIQYFCQENSIDRGAGGLLSTHAHWKSSSMNLQVRWWRFSALAPFFTSSHAMIHFITTLYLHLLRFLVSLIAKLFWDSTKRISFLLDIAFCEHWGCIFHSDKPVTNFLSAHLIFQNVLTSLLSFPPPFFLSMRIDIIFISFLILLLAKFHDRLDIIFCDYFSTFKEKSFSLNLK